MAARFELHESHSGGKFLNCHHIQLYTKLQTFDLLHFFLVSTQQRQPTDDRNTCLVAHHSTVPPSPHHGCKEQSHGDRSKNERSVLLVREYQLIPADAN
jgi:hypothetical protein